ncbi:MAG: TIGR03621 family F420-dependent LLM class oxidoreductase [Candidatus Limnocylindria bacterium]
MPAAGQRRFRFGVSVRSAGSRAEWIEKARRAEALGYDIFLVADHLAEMLPPLVPLVSVADATSLRVGTFVLNNDLRHPALVARDAATIDLLSDGRFELGLGAGHMQPEYEQIGLAFNPATTRIERLAESVRILKKLFRGEEVSFSGTHYQLSDHRLYPLPLQRPHPPLLIGANSREGLSLAAREADIVGLMGFGHRQGGRRVNPSGFTEAAIRTRIGWIRQAAGTRFENLELNVLIQRVIVTDDAGTAAADFAGQLAPLPEHPLSVNDVLGSPFVLIGTVDELIDEITERRERLGISYYVVFEPAMEAFAPIVQSLSGT